VRAKLTMSEDDIRAVFAILDEENAGEVDKNQVVNLFDETSTARKITRFY
jgi:Ca2+-binding EF-hand superfamily protein